MIVAGAMVNACLNFLLIPHFAALGAAAASVAAECFITSLYLWLGRDFIKLKMLVRYGWRRLVAAVIMLGAVVWTGQFWNRSGAWDLLPLYSDRCRRSGVFPGASGNA